MIILNDSWSIKKSGQSWDLIEVYESKDKEGELKLREKTRHYGTVYQALGGFVDNSIGDGGEEKIEPSSIAGQVINIMSCIDGAKHAIKEEFRIVKVVKG